MLSSGDFGKKSFNKKLSKHIKTRVVPMAMPQDFRIFSILLLETTLFFMSIFPLLYFSCDSSSKGGIPIAKNMKRFSKIAIWNIIPSKII